MERHRAAHEGGEHHPAGDGEPEQPAAAAGPEQANAEPPRIFLADASPDLPEEEALRGIWLDAAVDEDELQQAVNALLQTSAAPGERAYRIAAATGFEGFDISTHESLATAARVARGIVAHGRAFVAYIDAWGTDQEAVDEFGRYYVGSWPDVAQWAESVAEDFGWWEQINERLDEALVPYVRLDFERFGRELTYDFHVVEDDERGAIHIFRLAV